MLRGEVKGPVALRPGLGGSNLVGRCHTGLVDIDQGSAIGDAADARVLAAGAAGDQFDFGRLRCIGQDAGGYRHLDRAADLAAAVEGADRIDLHRGLCKTRHEGGAAGTAIGGHGYRRQRGVTRPWIRDGDRGDEATADVGSGGGLGAPGWWRGNCQRNG